MCLYPKLIINRKYTPNKKNNYNVPQIKDNRVLYVPVGCQKCMECRKQKARQWQIRMQEEVRTNKTGEYVTLTFSTESIKKLIPEVKGNPTGYDMDNAIATLGVRRFMERWRKKYKVSIKHWLITELGHNGTENIHLHGILFKNEYKHKTPGIKDQYLAEQKKDIEKIWQYGYVYIGDYVNERTVNYITKYVTKQDGKHKEYNAKILTSPGIGGSYTKRADAKLNKYKETETDETYKTRTGYKLNLPTYYRNKIYTEEEREKLWIQKLDKEERWVDGKKIDISKNDKEYYKALKQAQRKNKSLGYGNDKINWKQKEYTNKLRQLKIEERIKKNNPEHLTNEVQEVYLGITKYKTNGHLEKSTKRHCQISS